ncbi:putative tRNA (uracil-O(2)-)-methyltransferase [Aphelenchoides besseyi]|nr:putative tRNA (uracil-O(2)-)-methyltransferase [Aphelenchoides besseyi]
MFYNTTESNALVEDEVYSRIYKQIKENHGRNLVKTWTERTDPIRFVYEDCGIASYILSLRESSDLHFNYFVDLACGNGLLTFLLSASGLRGCAIDARKRKIWDRFAEVADLRQMSLNPTDSKCSDLPPETDFIIGNHSDELIPWIPILAVRRRCSFFIIPCCFHDFFCRFAGLPTTQANGASRYEQYLSYIESICVSLGFQVRVDRLKTTSSRRIAFLGTIPPNGLPENVEEIISQLLQKASRDRSQFTPIASVEPVRNCTRLPLEFRRNLSRKLLNVLLTLSDDHIKDWKVGGSLHLSKLMNTLDDYEKSQLKSQDGGLQTFFRNLHQAFQVKNGEVALRRWPEVYTGFFKAGQPKKSSCWFKDNHPQGCPLESSTCPYQHNK